MSYDVFLVAAHLKEKDHEKARLVARRLRSMRMRVWFDAKAEDDVFDAREARAIERSDAMLVLWSKNAVESNFVRGAAAQGYSRARDEEEDYLFLQAALDDVEPYDPYSADDLHDLSGFTTRTNTEGWFAIVEALEKYQGRRDLKEWLLIATKDKDAQDAWRAAHPEDRLAVKGTPPGQKKAEATPARAPASPPPAKEEARPAPSPPKPPVASEAPESAPPARAPAAAATRLSARTRPAPPAAARAGEASGGGLTVALILALIALFFLLAWAFRSLQAPQTRAAPPVAQARYLTCPPGTLPRDVFRSRLLEPGPVTDDTDTPAVSPPRR